MSSSIYNILKFFDIFLDSFEVKNIALQWRRNCYLDFEARSRPMSVLVTFRVFR